MQPPEPLRDAWLSDVLGFDAYGVTTASASAAPAKGRALYTCRVPAEDVEAVEGLADADFRIVDVNVTLEREGDGGLSGTSVAPAAAHQYEALLDIAGSCFRYSRFHLDPHIPTELAHRVKREWVRSYVEGRRGVELLAATHDGEAAGFLAVLEAQDGAQVIDLIGVAAAVQGRGIGESLVGAFAQRHGDGGRTLRVGTQVANVPSLRLYEKLGFRVVSATYVLHRHVGA